MCGAGYRFTLLVDPLGLIRVSLSSILSYLRVCMIGVANCVVYVHIPRSNVRNGIWAHAENFIDLYIGVFGSVMNMFFFLICLSVVVFPE